MSVRLALLKLQTAGIDNPRIEFSLGLGDAFCVHFKGTRGGRRFDLTHSLTMMEIDFDLAGLASEFVQGTAAEKRGRR